MSWLLLALGVAALAFSAVALRPPRWPTGVGLVAFLVGWIVGDLPVLVVVGQGVAAAALVGAGALGAWPGSLGLGLLVVAWAGLVRAHQTATTAHDVVTAALASAGVSEPAEAWSPRHHALPFPLRGRPGVRVERDLVIARVGTWKHRVDVFAPVAPGEGRPVLVFAHGGGWVMSFREFQGLPVIHRLVERGWVVVRTAYRLSPRAVFPDHLVDVKRALAWTRENAGRWGGDPDVFFGLHGNSAGAHLASLAALTPNDPRYQPGFEHADTRVDACVPVYGPTDLTNGVGDWGPDASLFLRWLVVGRPHGHPAWHEASPLHQVRPGSPPFLLVHGTHDTLVPPGESRRFAQAMRREGNPVDLVEIPGGQHALDIFHSRRGVAAADGVVRWLEHQRRLRREAANRDDREKTGVGG